MKKLISSTLLIAMFSTVACCQNTSLTKRGTDKDEIPSYKFSVSTPYLTFLNFGDEETNTHHYEFHFGYQITPKDKIGIKAATWKLFAPMGIPMWNPLFQDESEFYPGRLAECGIGITYQRMIWKGLFATVEILPLYKTYKDENNEKTGDGFKLYATFHIGYHLSMFKNRLFVEPQIHFNYWPIDTEAPQNFEERDSKWNNYFLFEPNIYVGINF